MELVFGFLFTIALANGENLYAITDPADIAAILEEHNNARDDVGVPHLVWDSALASRVHDWVMPQLCPYDGQYHFTTPGNGQNVFISWSSAFAATPPDATTRRAAMRQGVQKWVSEKADYTWGAVGDSNTCAAGKVCGHYTQVVWETTTKVGCSIATDCHKSTWGNKYDTLKFNCDYQAPGNMAGEYPYPPITTTTGPTTTTGAPAAATTTGAPAAATTTGAPAAATTTGAPAAATTAGAPAAATTTGAPAAATTTGAPAAAATTGAPAAATTTGAPAAATTTGAPAAATTTGAPAAATTTGAPAAATTTGAPAAATTTGAPAAATTTGAPAAATTTGAPAAATTTGAPAAATTTGAPAAATTTGAPAAATTTGAPAAATTTGAPAATTTTTATLTTTTTAAPTTAAPIDCTLGSWIKENKTIKGIAVMLMRKIKILLGKCLVDYIFFWNGNRHMKSFGIDGAICTTKCPFEYSFQEIWDLKNDKVPAPLRTLISP